MAQAAHVHREDLEPIKRPGDFARHPENGAPYVIDPTSLVDAKLKRAELVALCATHGIEVPDGAKVADLKRLLGDRAKRGRKTLYGRPSSLGKQIEDTTNLQKWAERAVALGIFLDITGPEPQLLADLEALDLDQLNLDDKTARTVLDAVAVRAKNRAQAGLAAERGTYVHERTEDYDTDRDWIEAAQRGDDLGLPAEVVHALVAAWETATTDLFEVLAVEATCVDDVWRQAGTLDRIARLRRDTQFITATGEIVTLPIGWTGILDIKTGKLRLGDDGFVDRWHGYAVQLASYAQSKPYDVDTDTRGEWPWEIDQQWAIIAHLDILAALDGEAKCRLVLVDLAAGRDAGALCVAARQWEHRRDVFSIPTDDLTVSVPVAVPPVDSTPADGQQTEAVAAASVTDAAQDTAPQVSTAEAQPADDPTPPRVSSATAVGAAEAEPPAPTAHDQRRRQLLERFNALPDDRRRAFKQLDIPAGDLDRIQAAIETLERGDPLPATPDVRRAFINRHVRAALDAAADTWTGPTFDGDEGGPVDENAVASMRSMIESIDPDTRRIVDDIARRALHTVGSIALRHQPTKRRWEIARGLVLFSLFGWSDGLVRAALADTTGDDACHDPAVDLGVIIGLLDHRQAAAFADIAAGIDRDSLRGVIGIDGRWQIVPAPASQPV